MKAQICYAQNYLHDRMWSCTGSSASETVNSTLHKVLLAHLTSFLSSSIWTWNGRKKEACIESQCLLCKRLFSISLIITSHKIWPLLTTVWLHFDLEIPRHSMTGWEGVTMIPCMKKKCQLAPLTISATFIPAWQFDHPPRSEKGSDRTDTDTIPFRNTYAGWFSTSPSP